MISFKEQYFCRLLVYVAILIMVVGGFGCSGDDPEQLFQQGIDAMESEKPDEAVIWFKKALQQRPEMAIAHYKIGQIYHKKGNAKQAYAELSRAVQQDPQLSEARKELAFLLVENRALKQVVEICKQYLEINGDDETIYLILANALAYTKDVDKAVKVLEEGGKIYPDNISFPVNLAKMLVVQGKVEEGRSMLESVAREKQDDINVQLALVQLYEKIERYDLASLILEDLIKRFPANAQPYLGLATLSLRKEQPDRAKAILVGAEKSGINDSGIYQMVAIIENRQGNTDKAVIYFTKAVDAATEATRQRSLMMLADYHSYLKNYKEAQELLETIIAEDSSKKQLQSKVVELFLAQGEYEQARNSVDALLEADSSNARGHFLRGLMMMQDKEVMEAREEFSRAKELAPNAAENQFLYGMTFLNESEQITISEISEALKKNPRLLKARMALAELYAKKGEYQGSLDQLNKIVAKQGTQDKLAQLGGTQADIVKVRVLRIAILMKMGQYDTALTDAKLLAEQQPDVPSHIFRLAEINFALKHFDNALPLYEELQSEKPDSVQLLNRIVGIHMLQKKSEQALETVDNFLAKYPENGSAQLIKAKIYLAQEADELAEKLLIDEAGKGDNIESLVMLADLYVKQDKTNLAVEYYDKAQKLAPENISIAMQQADLYLKKGMNNKAISSYEKVLTIKAQFLPAMNNLAFLYAEEGRDLGRALELASDVLKKLPDNPNVLDTLGWVYVLKGMYSEADPHMERALKGIPDNASILYHMGMLRLGQNKYEQADEFLQSSIAKGLKGTELQGANDAISKLEEAHGKVKRAVAEMNNGNGEKAIALFEEILNADGFNAEVAASLAVLYADNGKDLTKAFELAQKAYETQPSNALIADALGWVYYHQGSQLMAKQYIGQALENDADYGPAKAHLETVLQKEE